MMACLVVTEKLVIISCELQLLAMEEEGGERVVALPWPGEKCQGQTDDETGKSVSCLCVSPGGRLLAVCDDRKQVCVLTLPDFRYNRPDHLISNT